MKEGVIVGDTRCRLSSYRDWAKIPVYSCPFQNLFVLLIYCFESCLGEMDLGSTGRL